MKILEWNPGQLSFVRVFFLLPLREPIMRGAEEEGVTYCTTIGFFPQVEEQESYSPVSRSSLLIVFGEIRF